MTVTKAEISGLLSQLLKVNLAECNELVNEGPDSSEGGEEGETVAKGEMRRGSELPLPPEPPRNPKFLPRLGVALRRGAIFRRGDRMTSLTE